MSSTVIEDVFRSAQLDEHQISTSTQVSERKRDATERRWKLVVVCILPHSSRFLRRKCPAHHTAIKRVPRKEVAKQHQTAFAQ